jgi:hypothetical protein
MQLITVKIEKPDDTHFILSQTHFIKSVEGIHEALFAAVPGSHESITLNWVGFNGCDHTEAQASGTHLGCLKTALCLVQDFPLQDEHAGRPRRVVKATDLPALLAKLVQQFLTQLPVLNAVCVLEVIPKARSDQQLVFPLVLHSRLRIQAASLLGKRSLTTTNLEIQK